MLSEANITISETQAKQQFDLSQMTVYDELFSGEEYADMVFEEFLEYLVRVAYVMPPESGLE